MFACQYRAKKNLLTNRFQVSPNIVTLEKRAKPHFLERESRRSRKWRKPYNSHANSYLEVRKDYSIQNYSTGKERVIFRPR